MSIDKLIAFNSIGGASLGFVTTDREDMSSTITIDCDIQNINKTKVFNEDGSISTWWEKSLTDMCEYARKSLHAAIIEKLL